MHGLAFGEAEAISETTPPSLPQGAAHDNKELEAHTDLGAQHAPRSAPVLRRHAAAWAQSVSRNAAGSVNTYLLGD
jgi:hypothetical protein